MIDFLQNFFFFSLIATPVMAVLSFLIGLVTKEVRCGFLLGLVGAGAGFLLGVSVAGGLEHNDAWGNVSSLAGTISGCSYAAAGFLVGFGAGCETRNKTLGRFLILAGLQFPLAQVGFEMMRPALIRSEMAWWRPILVNGYKESSEADARDHLSEPTRLALEGGGPPNTVPASTLNVLFDIGVNITEYTPLPPELAKKIYANSPTDRNLARNPSTPPEILREMSKSENVYLLSNLALNPNLPQEILVEMCKNKDDNVLEVIAANPRLSPETARELYNNHQDDVRVKVGLARNTNTPVDLLVEMSEKDDVDVLYQLSLNKALPKTQYPLMESRCETIIQGEKAKPDFRTYGDRYNNARLLKQALEKRT